MDRLYAGTTYLRTALPALMLAAEGTLQLDETKRRRTILRIDAGAGSVEDINWALEHGYQVHAKDYSANGRSCWLRMLPNGSTIPMSRAVKWAGCKPQPACTCALCAA